MPKHVIRKGGLMEEKNNSMPSEGVNSEKYHVNIDGQTHILLTEIAEVKKQVDRNGRFLEKIFWNKLGEYDEAEKQGTAEKSEDEIFILTKEGKGTLSVNGAKFDVVNFEARSSANGGAELLVKIKGKELFTVLSSS